MTGWRIGYLACYRELAKAMGKIQSQSTSNPATPSQWASCEALLGDQSPVETMRVAFESRKLEMVTKLNAISGISCLEPEGAFYTFPNISAYFGKSSKGGVINGSVDFCRLLLEEALVACVPGAGFGADDYIRLSYSAAIEDIRQGLGRLEDWVNQLK
jgi:aspartate aminotransferase